tara:strand:+ start:5522 stop:5986 length:465 start_codon:yes stop_codon:yes gene_type:complete
MENRFIKYKGIHPGIIVKRELEKRFLKQRPFALSIGEHPQTFNAITKGKRTIPTSLALKIEKELELKEGTLVLLQAYYEIAIEKQKNKPVPNLSILRKILFWDTDIHSIDWQKQDKQVIQRVFERGNAEEKKEITRFYGKRKIQKELKSNAVFN